MEQLDILKSKWASQEVNYPTYNAQQLKGLLAKKSTSIVKWLLIIAVIEFIVMSGLGTVLSYFTEPDATTAALRDSIITDIIYISHFIIIVFFIALFYINYRRISAVQPTTSLMHNIIRTRKTMKWYIWYNIIGGFLTGMIFAAMLIQTSPDIEAVVNANDFNGSPFFVYAVVFIIVMFMYAVLMGLLYLLYMLIYGILLKRLKANYKELKRIEE